MDQMRERALQMDWDLPTDKHDHAVEREHAQQLDHALDWEHAQSLDRYLVYEHPQQQARPLEWVQEYHV